MSNLDNGEPHVTGEGCVVNIANGLRATVRQDSGCKRHKGLIAGVRDVWAAPGHGYSASGQSTERSDRKRRAGVRGCELMTAPDAAK
jgi:hypothetical protein